VNAVSEPVADWWKQTASALAGVACAMLAFWLSGANKYVTSTETIELIQKHSPYIEDKRFINESLLRMSSQMDKCVEQTSKLNDEIKTLRVELQNANK